MKVADILAHKSTQVFSIKPAQFVVDALKLLDSKRIGVLMVLDEDQQIQGIVSERDVVHMVADAKRSTLSTRVQDIMTPADRVIIGNNHDEVEYVMNVMTNNRIRHLPILGEDGRLAGLISIGDVIKALLNDTEFEKKMLSDYIQGKYPV